MRRSVCFTCEFLQDSDEKTTENNGTPETEEQ